MTTQGKGESQLSKISGLRLYLRLLWSHWFYSTFAVLAAIFTFYTFFKPAPLAGHTYLARWVGFIAVILAFSYSQFLSFRDLDAYRNSREQKALEDFDSIQYRFEMYDLVGRVIALRNDEGRIQSWYNLEAIFRNGGLLPLKYEVRKIEVTFGDDKNDPINAWNTSSDIILPGQSRRYILRVPLSGDAVGGEGNYTVAYGHPSKPNQFETTHRFGINWIEPKDSKDNLTILWFTKEPITHERVLGPLK
jgi:hypothetical protein